MNSPYLSTCDCGGYGYDDCDSRYLAESSTPPLPLAPAPPALFSGPPREEPPSSIVSSATYPAPPLCLSPDSNARICAKPATPPPSITPLTASIFLCRSLSAFLLRRCIDPWQGSCLTGRSPCVLSIERTQREKMSAEASFGFAQRSTHKPPPLPCTRRRRR